MSISLSFITHENITSKDDQNIINNWILCYFDVKKKRKEKI